MEEQMKKWLDDGIEYVSVKIVEGGTSIVRIGSIAGFCHCPHHNGFLTEKVAKRKECRNKRCFYFEQFATCPCLKKQSRQEIVREQNRLSAKIKKQARTQLQKLLSDIQQKAIELCARNDIVIVSVAEADFNRFVVRYVSDRPFNDAKQYAPIARELREEFGAIFRFSRIRKSNGRYATAQDLPNEKGRAKRAGFAQSSMEISLGSFFGAEELASIATAEMERCI